jgi:cobaltochelatase CobN
MKKEISAILCLIFILLPSTALSKQLALLVMDEESYLLDKSINHLTLPKDVKVKSFTFSQLNENPSAGDFIHESQVIVLDVMAGELTDYVLKNVDLKGKRILGLRRSRDDEGLKRKGFLFDSDIQEYFRNPSVANIQNMIYRILNQSFDPNIAYQKVDKIPQTGIYHTGATARFTNVDDYFNWYRSQATYDPHSPWIGMMLFASNLEEGQVEAIDTIINALENEGFNVLACFGDERRILTSFLVDGFGKPRVDIVLALSLKFYSALNEKMQQALRALKTPIFNMINLHGITIDQWRVDPVGIPAMDIVWSVANPEISGMIEPSLLTGKVNLAGKGSGKTLFVQKTIHENLELLLPRLKKWIKLKRCAQKDKRVAILYYNNSRGKQNVGATYLNVFASLELILNRMKDDGYQFEMDDRITREALKELVLKYGRNIGSWAPGELDRLITENKTVRIPIAAYEKWFDRLPEEFKKNVIRQWGPAQSSHIMTKDDHLIIPVIILGNVLIMPEPARGWGDDPMKLYHDTTLYPHHQYIAAYLWLKYDFHADAMIHLGTHGTHEWLPGKQAGLSPSCPPDVLITDIPNIYPYNVDVVGEGIQAKRRGRAVIVDHLTPAVKEGGLHHEYSDLYAMINNYWQSVSNGSRTDSAKLSKIEEAVKKLGLHKDLQISAFNNTALRQIEQYLLEMKESLMPYGLHTFGRSPDGEELEDTVTAIIKQNPSSKRRPIKSALTDSGPREINHLMKGLDGGYIPPGPGNDPIRNPSVIPTGNNFYGFDPNRIPSKTAWELGKWAAEQLIEKSLTENGKYPEKVAVILWSTETIRNEGLNESTILHLMGLKPVWDSSNRVTGITVVPGKELNRPRIDVLINPSGLYRDLFPNFMLFLDKAVQKASIQTDIQNLIAEHNASIKTQLIQGGMDEKDANLFSKIRIFTEKPGDYGTGVDTMASNSGIWETAAEVAAVFENREGNAFGMGKWGAPAKKLFKENLKEVNATIHSLSSNIFGTMDNDDMFQYLGGLSLAVKQESGRDPDTLITLQRSPGQVTVENAAKTFGREIRTRYLNPKWIEGMKKEGYAGAREMSNYVEYMWGWQVTVPKAIDKVKWEQTYEVYVQDKYGLDIKEFLNKENPWAYQSITARMAESIRKGYWKADDSTKKKLAVEYAMNVAEKGVACCDHTCNNPLLNQMVVNIISMPGVMSPEMVEKFKIAIEQAAGKTLEQQVRDRKMLQKKLTEGFKKSPQTPNSGTSQTKSVNKEQPSREMADEKSIEGYKMEEIKKTEETTDLASSGVQWFASLFIVLIMGLAVIGARRAK